MRVELYLFGTWCAVILIYKWWLYGQEKKYIRDTEQQKWDAARH
jgi:hypothetical protein